MNFLNNFESKIDGVNDTVEFVIRVSIITLSAVILVVVMALVVGLFLPNDIVDSTAILEMINPAFQTIIGAFVGLLGGLSLNANARDTETPVEPEPAPTLDDDEMAPWEMYRNDLRYDNNDDGTIDEKDFPNWRNTSV
ncbi:hypothetical protein UFOVP506_32 [uncultured Caudovirales phage]|uniref:Uncharacterized protein n=1 Tax=uncultured Caudovirales phage TaxID=2100421 RepID=A0A6J5MK48_9CAUD|nr:hypothetical protein UFOVP506_32 [uncultured Caudovirales phage]